MALTENARDSNTDPEATKFVGKKGPQYIAGITVMLGNLALGTVLGWSSPALPSMESQGDFGGIKTSSQTASWIASFAPLGGIFAGFVAGFAIDGLGRKRGILLFAPLCVSGWLCMAFAPSVIWILIGRFITGLCVAAFNLCGVVYLSEICEPSIRGALCNAMQLTAASGIVFAYTVGTFLSWSEACLVHSTIPIMFGICMSFMPETPVYLLRSGNADGARKSLRRLRGATCDLDIEPELKQLEASLEEMHATWSVQDLKESSVLKPTAICLLLMFLQQMSGVNAVVYYSIEIFKSAGSDLDANLSSIIVALVMVMSMCVSTILVERLGRKPLLAISELGMAGSLLGLGVYFFLAENGYQEWVNTLSWLPLTTLVTFITFYNLGAGPLPWTLMGELLPHHVKGVISSFTSGFRWLMGFLVAKFFVDLVSLLTAPVCYWMFSAWSVFGFIFCLVVVPETKGKSLDEIQKKLNSAKI